MAQRKVARMLVQVTAATPGGSPPPPMARCLNAPRLTDAELEEQLLQLCDEGPFLDSSERGIGTRAMLDLRELRANVAAQQPLVAAAVAWLASGGELPAFQAGLADAVSDYVLWVAKQRKARRSGV